MNVEKILEMNVEKILKLEPSHDADRAFAELLLGWEIPPGIEIFQPTTGNNAKGDPSHWWLGVERLNELGFCPEITVHESMGFSVSVYPRRVGYRTAFTHKNIGIAILRASVEALELTKQNA